MLVLERILAIPDQSVDYLQCGIAGKERAALEKRGFVRKDGIKAKDYMIRTIQKTEKNKEKAIIKGDKKLAEVKGDRPISMNELKQKATSGDAIKLGNKSVRIAENPDNYRKIDITFDPVTGWLPIDSKGNELSDPTKWGTSSFTHRFKERSQAENFARKVMDKVEKQYPVSKAEKPASRGMAVTYNKQGDLSAGSAAKKIKGAIATSATPKSRKVVKGMSPRDRGKFDVNKSLAEIAETKGVKPPSSGFGEISPVQASIGRSNSMSGQPSSMMRENSRRRATERETYKAKLEPIEKEYKEKAIKAFENKKYSLYDAFAFHDSKGHTDTEGKPTITAWDVLNDELKNKGIETPSPFSLVKLRSKGGEKAVKAKLDELQNQYLEKLSKPKRPSAIAKKLNITAKKEADILKRLKKY